MHFKSKYAALLPMIQDICSISGIPGMSLGVIENNQTVYTASLGYADIESKIPCDSDTTFVLGSLTKAMTAALLASLHDDGIISSWDAPLETLLPEFHREDIYGKISLADLLTHRTGLAPLDSLWLSSNNVRFLPKAEAVQILRYAPGVHPFRSHFLYNNFGYEVLGQVIEKASDAPFAEVLHRRLLSPLGMNRTYYTGESRNNEAKPYAALEDGSIVPIAPPLQGKDVLMGPAGGVRSSVNDLLILYKAFMDGARDEMTYGDEKPKSPLRCVRQLLQAHIPLPSLSLREHSYAFGWARAQLPAVLSPGDDGPSKFSPMVGKGAPSRLALYHGGIIPGFHAYNVLFPETNSAVIILTNSQSLNGGVRWIGELIVETLLNNSQNALDYRDVAKKSTEVALQRVKDLNKSLAAGRTVQHPSRIIDVYVGCYYNAIRNFFIRIELSDDKTSLQVAFMGRKADTFSLIPYGEDSFYWTLTYDESARLAREAAFPAEYYILNFGSMTKGSDVSCLWWKHEPNLPGPGEMFKKMDQMTSEGTREEL